MLFVLVFKIAFLRKILDHNLFWVVYFGPNSDETEKKSKVHSAAVALASGGYRPNHHDINEEVGLKL